MINLRFYKAKQTNKCYDIWQESGGFKLTNESKYYSKVIPGRLTDEQLNSVGTGFPLNDR